MIQNAPLIVGEGSAFPCFLFSHLMLDRTSSDLSSRSELLDPSHLRHIIVSPRQRAQTTARLLFAPSKDFADKVSWETTEDVGEWQYGEYEGLLVRSSFLPFVGCFLLSHSLIPRISTSSLSLSHSQSSEIAARRPGWTIWRDGCPSSSSHSGETAEEMEARVDAVIEKVRALHRAAEEEGCGKAGVETEASMKERRRAAEEADVLIVSHGHFSRCFIA